MLRAQGVTKRYGDRRALDGVTFGVEAGERVAVIGPNGAGKTTLLQILAGALRADDGSVEVERVGWVPQQPALYSKLSVEENLRLFARLERVGDVDAAVARGLAQTGLQERAGDEVGSLSGGNRQRVNVAIGLLAEPPVLLLDEPSTALDPRQRERLWGFLGPLDATILFSTHELSEAEQFATRALVLDEGRLIHDGPAGEGLARRFMEMVP